MKAIRSFHQRVLFAWVAFSLQDESLKAQLQGILDYAHKKMKEGRYLTAFFPELIEAAWSVRLNIIRWAAQRGVNINAEMPDVLEWLDSFKTDSAAKELFESIQIAIEMSGEVVHQIIETVGDDEKLYYIPDEIFALKYNQLREIVKLAETPYRSDVVVGMLDASLALELGGLIAVDIYDQQIPVSSEQIADLTDFVRAQTYAYQLHTNLLIDITSRDVAKQLTLTHQWPAFVNEVFGCMADAPIERFDEGNYETRAEFL